MVQTINVPESLKDKTLRIKRALKDEATGPLVTAVEIVSIANAWDSWKEEAGGIACTTWLRREISRGRALKFWVERADAVSHLGEDVRRWMHHSVAIWVHNKAPNQDTVQKAKFALRASTNANGRGAPLTLRQAKLVLKQIIPQERRPRKCARCKALEDLLKKNGVAIE